MPHITVQMFPGRDEEKKRELAHELALAAARVLKVPDAYVSVSIQDVPEAAWDLEVYNAMRRDRRNLYKEPDYGEG